MRKSLLLFSTALLAACKINMPVSDDGRVVSLSGARDCGPGETCEFDVSDTFFEETFTAVPGAGQVFLGWRKRDRGLCGGTAAPCELSTSAFAGDAALAGLLASDETFFLQPVFAPTGGPSFNVRYCEVLIGRAVDDGFEAEVWGSQSLNDCPEAKVRALDPVAIARDNDAEWANINGPRYWVIDNLQLTSIPPGFRAPEDIRREFGGIEMRLITSVRLSGVQGLLAAGGYQVAEVARGTLFTFVKGRRVYELEDPAGSRYLMQSFSQAVKQRQDITELADLGSRLQLPPGWRFRSYILDEALQLPSVDGIARVVTDNLENTYQLLPEQ